MCPSMDTFHAVQANKLSTACYWSNDGSSYIPHIYIHIYIFHIHQNLGLIIWKRKRICKIIFSAVNRKIHFMYLQCKLPKATFHFRVYLTELSKDKKIVLQKHSCHRDIICIIQFCRTFFHFGFEKTSTAKREKFPCDTSQLKCFTNFL